MKLNVIYIMWLRQLKRYWRIKARIIGSLGQPLLFLFALGFGLGPIFSRAGEGSYLDFLAPGVICQAVLFTAVYTGIELIWDRQFGFLKATLAAPVSRLEVIIGRTIGGATIAVFQGVIVFCLTLFLGFKPKNISGLGLALLLVFLIALLYSALGTAIASLMKDFHGFQLIMNFLVMPTFFLSGAISPLEKSPAVMRKIALFNPLSYGVDGLRQVLIGRAYFSLPFNIFILSVIIIILLFLGSWFFSKIEA